MKFLICDEDKNLYNTLCECMKCYFRRNHLLYRIAYCSSVSELHNVVQPFDVLFTEFVFGNAVMSDSLFRFRQRHPSTTIIILSSSNEFAVEGYKLGVFRYILKSQLLIDLPHCLDDIMAYHTGSRESISLKFIEGKYSVYQDNII